MRLALTLKSSLPLDLGRCVDTINTFKKAAQDDPFGLTWFCLVSAHKGFYVNE